MNHKHFPKSWQDPVVAHYDQTIPLKIAGYHLLYDLTSHLMAVGLKNESSTAKLLIVGAGGGQELVTLSQFNKDWQFTAIDSSETMLDVATRRVNEAKISERVCTVHSKLEDFSDSLLYDGATCLLVLHFIKGLENKRAFLKQISAKLKPGAPFFFAAINGEPDKNAYAVQMKGWKSYMLAQGIPAEEFDKFAESIGDMSRTTGSDLISSDVTLSLLAECGFTDITSYFGSYLIQGYMAFKE